MNGLKQAAVIAVSAFASVAPAVSAQDYPTEAVELINPASPGGGTDIFLRMLAAASDEHFDGNLVVQSKAGGQGLVAMNYGNNQPKDGHTLLAVTSGQLLTVAEGEAPFELEDLIPVVVGTVDPMVLVSQPGRFESAEALIEEAKERQLMTGGTMAGNNEWMALMAVAKAAGLEEPAYIPMQSGGEVMLNVIGGNVDVGVGNLTEVTERVQNGELDALMVLSDERSEAPRDVPTARELGLDVSMAQVRGLVALAGTPQERVDMLEAAFLEGMNSSQYQEYLTSNGLDSSSIGDSEKWGAMMEDIVGRMTELRAEFSPDLTSN